MDAYYCVLLSSDVGLGLGLGLGLDLASSSFVFIPLLRCHCPSPRARRCDVYGGCECASERVRTPHAFVDSATKL